MTNPTKGDQIFHFVSTALSSGFPVMNFQKSGVFATSPLASMMIPGQYPPAGNRGDGGLVFLTLLVDAGVAGQSFQFHWG